MAGYISKPQYRNLKSRIRGIINNFPNQIPQFIIYLLSTTATLIGRIRERGRNGERKITKDYLQTISNAQHYWLEKLNRAYGIKICYVFVSEDDSEKDVDEKVRREIMAQLICN